MPPKPFGTKAPADTQAGHPDEIAGVPEKGDQPSDVNWDKPRVSVTMSKPFQSPTIELELASCKQLPVVHIKHDMAPSVPVASPITIK